MAMAEHYTGNENDTNSRKRVEIEVSTEASQLAASKMTWLSKYAKLHNRRQFNATL